MTLIGDNLLFPGYSTVISLLKSATTSTNYPSLNYVSAKHLLSPCTHSLLKYLDHSNPDCQVWLDSYDDEKNDLIDHGVYDKISKIQYIELKRAGKIPKAIPSMCVLLVKNEKYGKPLRAMSRIAVLGNFEERIYQNAQRNAPVLKYKFLRLITAKSVGDKIILHQGD